MTITNAFYILFFTPCVIYTLWAALQEFHPNPNVRTWLYIYEPLFIFFSVIVVFFGGLLLPKLF